MSKISISEFNKKTKTQNLKSVVSRIKEVHGDEVKIDESTYVASRHKARFIDAKFGEFWSEPRYVINRGYRHPENRKKSRIIPVDVVKKNLEDKFVGKIKIVDETYISMTKKCKFLTEEGLVFESTPKLVLKLNINGRVLSNSSKNKDHDSVRRERVRLATPKWLTPFHKKAMSMKKQLCSLKTKITGIPHHVDHIMPIKGINEKGEHIFCGLNVPWNLEIVKASDNIRNRNKIKLWSLTMRAPGNGFSNGKNFKKF